MIETIAKVSRFDSGQGWDCVVGTAGAGRDLNSGFFQPIGSTSPESLGTARNSVLRHVVRTTRTLAHCAVISGYAQQFPNTKYS